MNSIMYLLKKDHICFWCWVSSSRMVNEGAGAPRSRRGSHKVVPSSDQDGTGAERATGEVPCPSNGETDSLNKKHTKKELILQVQSIQIRQRQNSHFKSLSFVRSNVGHSTLTHWNQLQHVLLSIYFACTTCTTHHLYDSVI